MSPKDYYDLLIEYGIATEKEIDLVVNINGWCCEVLDSIVYARTGYPNIEEYYKYKYIYKGATK
tara:strand:- start:2903 stop:3094 length:192 start_codon:yes stop_codon:yes gene_type:complete